MKILIFATHPIQYQVPIYRELSKQVDLTVIYMLSSTKKMQADSGFSVEFDWDIPLYDGYSYEQIENIASVPTTKKYKGIVLKNLDKVFKKHNPDKVIVHGWFPYGMKQVINYCFKDKIEIICRGDSTLLMVKNPLKKVLKEIYIRLILRKLNKFLYVGENNKQFYLHYGVKINRLFKGVHSINTNFFKEEFSKYPKTEAKKIKIGFAGKLMPIKRPLDLLQSVALSKYKNDIEVVIIGDGPLMNQMKECAKMHTINASFLGFLNQSEIVKNGYSNLDVLVLPSESETWGLVVNEVMTGGIPVIVSNTVGCAPDLVEEGKTGYVFRKGNVIELKEKIDLFIESKKQNMDFYSMVTSKIENYSLQQTVEGYMKCLNSSLF